MTYAYVDQSIRIIGRHSEMAKFDIENAYRLLPVRLQTIFRDEIERQIVCK